MSRRRRGLAWVCKTDIMRFRRCPYAFWLVDRGIVDPEAVISPSAREAISQGIAFEAGIVDTAEPLPSDLPIEEALSGDRRVFGLPLFENKDLEIYGIPDG